MQEEGGALPRCMATARNLCSCALRYAAAVRRAAKAPMCASIARSVRSACGSRNGLDAAGGDDEEEWPPPPAVRRAEEPTAAAAAERASAASIPPRTHTSASSFASSKRRCFKCSKHRYNAKHATADGLRTDAVVVGKG